MKFREFREKFSKYEFVDSKTISLQENANYLRRQISEWQDKGWLGELKKGIYFFKDYHGKKGISVIEVANLIYQPSYVSLEYAFQYYGLIPEAVKQITSITTKKTNYFENDFGRFSYRSIKPSLYWGFVLKEEFENKIFIARPEKALIDFFYYRLTDYDFSLEFFEQFRFQNLEILDLNLMQEYIRKVDVKKLQALLRLFLSYVDEELKGWC